MLTIHKFHVPATDEFSLTLSAHAKVLDVQVQGYVAKMWVLLDPNGIGETRTFRVFGTGHPIDHVEMADLQHVGTFQLNDGALVFHVFEVVAGK